MHLARYFISMWIFSVLTRYTEGMTAEVQPWVLLRRRFTYLEYDRKNCGQSFGRILRPKEPFGCGRNTLTLTVMRP